MRRRFAESILNCSSILNAFQVFSSNSLETPWVGRESFFKSFPHEEEHPPAKRAALGAGAVEGPGPLPSELRAGAGTPAKERSGAGAPGVWGEEPSPVRSKQRGQQAGGAETQTVLNATLA